MGRLRGCIWLAAGLVIALLAGFVGFATLQKGGGSGQQPAAAPDVSVVVAKHAVAVRSPLKAEDLDVKKVPVNAAPEGALQRIEDGVGKITLVDLYTGETVLQPRLVNPQVVSADARQAIALAPEQVLVAYPAADLMSKSGLLKPGDHVDLLFTYKFPVQAAGGTAAAQDTLTTWDGLQNVTIEAKVASNPNNQQGAAADGIFLAVSPQDALTLKHLKDAGATLDLVLRAPGAEQPFTTEPVDGPYLIRRYRIPAGTGR